MALLNIPLVFFHGNKECNTNQLQYNMLVSSSNISLAFFHGLKTVQLAMYATRYEDGNGSKHATRF